MYTTIITIDHDIDLLEQLFQAEDKDLGRSSYKLSKKNNLLQLEVIAKDAIAFKTAVNTIAKVLQIWEKSTKI
jgi:tRNA threonylcarbamoyladenosine modification (KEOPS) complex  Pcc1 subunit